MGTDAKSTRDVRLDALRGLLLVIMTIDHLPASFSDITYGALGFVTAAEGFVFLSGLVAGRVYNRYSLLTGEPSLWQRAVKRAAVIYSYHVLVFILLLSLAVLGLKTFYLENWVPLFFERPVVAMPLGLSLTFQPQLLDVLPMYCLFILLVPWIVRCLKSGRFALVLVPSGLLWLVSQFGVKEYIEDAASKYAPVNFGYFDILAWQFIFVLGVIAGVGSRKPVNLTVRLKSTMLIGCACLAMLLFMVRHHYILSEALLSKIEFFASVPHLGPLRLLNFLLLAYLASSIFVWPTDNVWNNSLAFLGRYSLQIFTYHIFLVYIFYGLVLHSVFKDFWVILCVASLALPALIFKNQKLLVGWVGVRKRFRRI